jgi:hypothetical protein
MSCHVAIGRIIRVDWIIRCHIWINLRLLRFFFNKKEGCLPCWTPPVLRNLVLRPQQYIDTSCNGTSAGTSQSAARGCLWTTKQNVIFQVSSAPKCASSSCLRGLDWFLFFFLEQQTNSVAWVHEQIMPTDRPSLDSEVIANFYGQNVPRCQRDGSVCP